MAFELGVQTVIISLGKLSNMKSHPCSYVINNCCGDEIKGRFANVWSSKHDIKESLTLSQWSSSGNPVAIRCAWNLDPSVHWNATGEINVGSQCVSSVLPVVF